MLSIIIPFFNEKENLPILVLKLKEQLDSLDLKSEIILVDDGSLDHYDEKVVGEFGQTVVKLKKLNRQMGKGRALSEGLKESSGDVIIFMDADLQDDPADLPTFYKKLNEGFDLVNGYRVDRKDNFLIKIYSKTAGWFLRKYLHSPFSDINCGFKMFRRKVLKNVVLYGNNFRFFPIATYFEGFKVSEVPVHNHPRIHGKSKFGVSKLLIGAIDMLSAYFLYKFSERPLHFFGMIGSIFFGIGGLMLAVLTYERIFFGILLYRRQSHLGDSASDFQIFPTGHTTFYSRIYQIFWSGSNFFAFCTKAQTKNIQN